MPRASPRACRGLCLTWRPAGSGAAEVFTAVRRSASGFRFMDLRLRLEMERTVYVRTQRLVRARAMHVARRALQLQVWL